ncbi:proline-tRNA ligase [Cyphellophora europaea CBS 101466]|uniref:proline--tRNA ligase n=1 Tax=Cyphellophora europaea (strain CBS 101466) TaxID=1220924 RepID=W2S1Z2_CYPE1|nr:proline-tRNA ligase [Cyphellophora europaea CBS 101466]ETN42068.1 proline-tRNA ligase [Cyphellophora europaea CBS 101466]
MQSVGASKLSLSSISSQKLWEQSGRLTKGSEIFKFEDRAKAKWLLTPTHEEEITTLLKSEIFNEQHLPIRLYQIGRKYRDEQRPRGGLLRGREFLMKDLYTFDATPAHAKETYQIIRQAYSNLFEELGVSFFEVRALSGDMGGNLSHEFHIPSKVGEDTVIICNECDHSRNEEFVSVTNRTIKEVHSSDEALKTPPAISVDVRDYVNANGSTLARVILPMDPHTTHPYASTELNTFAVKEAMEDFGDIHTGIEEHKAVQMFEQHVRTKATDENAAQLVYVVDKRVTEEQIRHRTQQDMKEFGGSQTRRFVVQSDGEGPVSIDLISARTGDACPECKTGTLHVHKAIEIGHTFHLGTRYSAKLGLNLLPKHKGGERVPVEMGCHGIGVTRLLAAAVASKVEEDAGDSDDILWPRTIAPYDVVICTVSKKPESLEAAHQLYDRLVAPSVVQSQPHLPSAPLDVVLDDRQDQNYRRKLREATFIGYPIIVALGKSLEKGAAEIICPSFGHRQDVPLEGVPAAVTGLVQDLDRGRGKM